VVSQFADWSYEKEDLQTMIGGLVKSLTLNF